MRTVKCFRCFRSFTEADKEWDLARESGACPFCNSPMQQFSEGSDDEFITYLKRHTKKSELAKRYSSADKLEDLLFCAAERLCLSAASISFALPRKRRGRLVLRAIKKFHPKKYESFWDREDNLFLQCLIFVTEKLWQFLYKHSQGEFQWDHLMKIASFACNFRVHMLAMFPDDKERFYHKSSRVLATYHRSIDMDDSEQLHKIIEAYGKTPSMKKLARLLREALVRDPLMIIEPWELIPNYKRLLG